MRGYEGTRVRGYEDTRIRGYEDTRIRGYEGRGGYEGIRGLWGMRVYDKDKKYYYRIYKYYNVFINTITYL